MKTLFAVAAIAVLSGCATQPYYASRMQPVSDPYQWHTVSVTPANGASSTTTYTTEELPAPSSRVVYTTEPVYASQPVYVSQPLYAPAPAYYYPPVTLGLDFVIGGWCCGGHRSGWGGRGYYRHR